jgi:hypothetical protein
MGAFSLTTTVERLHYTRGVVMVQAKISGGATPTHNQAGCPYLNQTGCEAVKDWAQVLARLDLLTLQPDLQVELKRLQLGCSSTDMVNADQ